MIIYAQLLRGGQVKYLFRSVFLESPMRKCPEVGWNWAKTSGKVAIDVKLTIRIASAVAILLLGFEIYGYVYNRIHSRQIATEMVQKLCREQGYNLTKLIGPVAGGVGDSPVSYSWSYNDTTRHLELLVSFDYFYSPRHIAIWDFGRKGD
jgi:hypothetical protein